MDTQSYVDKSNRYCAYALILFSLALVVFTIGVFSWGPESIMGLISVAIGVLLMLGCIACFVLFNHYLKRTARS